MVSYRNGELPPSILIQLDTGGGKHLTTRASAARWYALRAWVKAEYGVTLQITSGWNAYRPLVEQHAARKWACDRGNCLGAAYPGTSSHGGNWWKPGVGWVDAMAFDVGNWWLLTWDSWVKACARFGLLAGGIPLNVSGGVDERHHIIDLNPFGPVPAGLTADPLEIDMPLTPADIEAIWNHKIQEQDENGRYIPTSTGVPARGHLAFASAQAGAANRGAKRNIAKEVWDFLIRTQKSDGTAAEAEYKASGFLANTNALVSAGGVDVGALAVALAPLLVDRVGALSDEDVARLAGAVNDEQDRRARERLA